MSAETKRLAFRVGLSGADPLVAVGAHDAMSARLIGSYGFGAVWVSGFGVSASSYAMPDANLLTMTETLEASVRIDAATDLPVLVDCDNGFGALANVVRTAREFERAGIAGISIEDNVFPKRNSLRSKGHSRRDLVPVAEQARRLRAAKRSIESPSFVLVARIEALIAGCGVAEACRRADAYADAGADALLVHSRDASLGELDGFLSSWRGVGRVPLIAVPTLFPTFTVEDLHARGFQMIILANQLMRASVQAMEQCLDTLCRTRRAADVDPAIAPVEHVFRLVEPGETDAGSDLRRAPLRATS